jgi:pSer/pThr/pTyr-binding forkhead associated (FHA) protein
MFVRDAGSRNGTWVFVDTPYTLVDGDRLLIGSQILQFRRISALPPLPATSDGTRPLGSLTPAPDVAALLQLRADGSVRDTRHLASASTTNRPLVMGREMGDWIFPYDQTMSGRHAELREENGEFVITDLGSRNGIAVAVQREWQLQPGQRVLAGDQLLRVESV